MTGPALEFTENDQIGRVAAFAHSLKLRLVVMMTLVR